MPNTQITFFFCFYRGKNRNLYNKYGTVFARVRTTYNREMENINKRKLNVLTVSGRVRFILLAVKND